jgi:hypothetical protein
MSGYSDAQSYVRSVVGTPNMQYNNVFGVNAKGHPNTIHSLSGQMLGGKQRKSLRKSLKKSLKKRGGMWGQVINQAIVPFGLLGMQQSYRRKNSNRSNTRRRQRSRRYRR